MEYKLQVTKIDKNPKWTPQRDAYDRRPEEPEYLTYQECLMVTLTDQEFKTVKKAVIEVII